MPVNKFKDTNVYGNFNNLDLSGGNIASATFQRGVTINGLLRLNGGVTGITGITGYTGATGATGCMGAMGSTGNFVSGSDMSFNNIDALGTVSAGLFVGDVSGSSVSCSGISYGSYTISFVLSSSATRSFNLRTYNPSCAIFANASGNNINILDYSNQMHVLLVVTYPLTIVFSIN